MPKEAVSRTAVYLIVVIFLVWDNKRPWKMELSLTHGGKELQLNFVQCGIHDMFRFVDGISPKGG